MFGTIATRVRFVAASMAGFPSPLGGDDDVVFDEYDEFVSDHLPDPGPFLDAHDVLTGTDHLAVHETARDLFEERTVYDMTFGYNLARLNLDSRHTGAGYRYALAGDDRMARRLDADDPTVLRAEFTPTTLFCPQTTTLTVGSFRAWNGLSERHEFDLVRIRAPPMHHQSRAINDRLEALEAEYVETGTVPGGDGTGTPGTPPTESTPAEDQGVPGPRSPF